ncbi:MAG: alpha-mannosidase [Actinomycetota bacterium]
MPLLTTPQRIERLRSRLKELAFWVDRAEMELGSWTVNGTEVPLGGSWPERDGVVLLAHPRVELPPEWVLANARLELDLGGEGLLRIRYDDGAQQTWGLDPEHGRWPLDGRAFSVEVRATARKLLGAPNPDPRLRLARVVDAQIELEHLERRLQLVVEAAVTLGAAEVVDPLLECAERALARLEWPSATEVYLARTAGNPWNSTLWTPLSTTEAREPLTRAQAEAVAAAGRRLADDLASLRGRYPNNGALALTGHAHLDVAWLWPLEATRHKAVHSFSTAAGLMDGYDDFIFNQSSAQLYSFVEEDDPALFARVLKRVAEGRWEPIGGMWVEPDMNMPCGESIVRQLLYGQRYFRDRFGSSHTVCWLPDCFGFTPALPQLLRGAGIDGFVTIKVNWSESNRFPYDLFWWEGLDGSRVLAHTFDNPDRGYCGVVGPVAFLETWANYRGKHRHPESLLSVGYGDGGGGPTAEMIERRRELAGFPSVPRSEFVLVRDFFARAHSSVEGGDVPTWVGELYLEYHRGTLTSQGRTKHLHRRAERALVSAEVIGAMDALAGGAVGPSLEHLWHVVLRNEFHDVLPGSGVGEIHDEATEELGQVVREADQVIERGLDALAARVAADGAAPALMAVNPDLSARPLRVHLDSETLGAQAVRDGYVLSASQQVPALGAVVVTEASPAAGLTVSTELLENAFVKVVLNEDGTLASVYDKRASREVLAGCGNRMWVYVDKPRAWDAWDVDVDYTDSAEELAAATPAEVVERGPHRAAVRVERRWRASRIVQEVRLWSNSPRIDFATRLDWHDRRHMLKARFPLAVRSTHALFETAFGVVQRPTFRNTTWDTAQFEVPGHRFADLSEPGYGVALLNDGRYGHHALGNELGLTLLRSPVYPDPRADEGRHELTYALCPHSGGWVEGGVLAEAEDLNRPLLARLARADSPRSWTALELGGLPLGLGALKPAEDGGGLVLRAYEPQGARGTASLRPPAGWRLDSGVNVLEEPEGSPEVDFTPFRVRSWLLSRS